MLPTMLQKLKYIIYLITLLCYFQAAFEVNNDYILNTWGDEYDTYISANDEFHELQKIEQSNDLVFLPTFQNKFDLPKLHSSTVNIVPIYINEQLKLYKIFLQQRKLLI